MVQAHDQSDPTLLTAAVCLMMIVLVILVLAQKGCVLGNKGVDISRPTSTEQGAEQDVELAAGEGATIVNVSLQWLGANAGWAVGALAVAGWLVSGRRGRRAFKATQRVVVAVEDLEAAAVKQRVAELGGRANGGDDVERFINCMIRKLGLRAR